MRIDAVLVEPDGIVLDTLAPRREALNGALAEHGAAVDDTEYWEWCAGWPTSMAVRSVARERALNLDETALDLAVLKADRAFANYLAKGSVLVEGARSALERLAARHRLGAVSRLRRADLEAVLSMGRLEHVFSFIIGDEDASPAKPHPASYHAALRRLGRFRGGAPGSVVALENGTAGIRAAMAAGIPCVAVGPHPAHIALEAAAYQPSLAALDPASLAVLLDPPDHA